MNSTKTRSLLSTVSLTAPHTANIYNTHTQLTNRVSSCHASSKMFLHTRSLVQIRSDSFFYQYHYHKVYLFTLCQENSNSKVQSPKIFLFLGVISGEHYLLLPSQENMSACCSNSCTFITRRWIFEIQVSLGPCYPTILCSISNTVCMQENSGSFHVKSNTATKARIVWRAGGLV